MISFEMKVFAFFIMLKMSFYVDEIFARGHLKLERTGGGGRGVTYGKK